MYFHLIFDERWIVRLSALEVLRDLGAHAAPYVDAIAACLGNEDSDVRVDGAEVLGALKCWHAALHIIEAIVACLDDENGLERGVAMQMLGALKEHAAPYTDAIAERLLHHDDAKLGLGVAAKYGQQAIVRLLLLAAGVDVNDRHSNGTGTTPLGIAAQYGQAAVVTILIQAGADVNKASRCYTYVGLETPLHIAARSGAAGFSGVRDKGEVAKILIEAGADVNKMSFDHMETETPLHVAVHCNTIEVVKTLLEAPGLDVNRVDKNGKTPLAIAESYADVDLMRVLLSHARIDVSIFPTGGSMKSKHV
jgi:ankyrin repeat protein